MSSSSVVLIVALALVGAACTTAASRDADAPTAAAADGDPAAEDTETQPEAQPVAAPTFPPAPEVPDGPIADDLAMALARYTTNPSVPDLDAIEAIGASGDPRALWVLSDILRFAFDPTTAESATDAADRLSGLDLRSLDDFPWGPLTDHLIAWDLPAFDGYVDVKAAIFTAVEPSWRPFFDDATATIDWRQVSWGGVRIDDRPLGDPDGCPAGCIPALDDPVLVPADEGDWYPDDAIVFGVVLGEDAVALPRNQMEVHEMVNATIGGRRVAIPYCTLCGAAQVFLTDAVEGAGPDGVVMRTSGLLRRSNKVMYDLTTGSVFDTFTGAAVTGPLLDAGVVLPQATVVTSSWGEWRAAHPDTTIIAEDGGIGRTYPLDPLRGRDDDGPIFPIGQRDDRLPVQEQVVGVVLPDGRPIAFPAAAARAALADGRPVEEGGVALAADAGGLVATVDGEPVPAHQAFWFAWSQFHPDTALWTG